VERDIKEGQKDRQKDQRDIKEEQIIKDQQNILIVEDDPDINTLLAKIVSRAGYRATQAFSGTEAQLRISTEIPSLILLDLMIPGITGEALIEHVRQELALDVPILVISAKASLRDKVNTISAGADDYITKPFEPEEVVVRIQAALRRSAQRIGTGGGAEGAINDTNAENAQTAQATGDNQNIPNASPSQENTTFIHKELTLNTTSRRVILKGEDVVLTNHEFDILHILIQAPDKVFSRERLYELVWNGGYYGEDNTINVHVSNIRKKFAQIAPDDEYIKTVWGIGFKLA
jgi:DNA-binding response OmpR family regulator